MHQKDNDITICKNHPMPVLYRGWDCPWCDFIKSMETKLTDEYKRGFTEGLAAAKKETK